MDNGIEKIRKCSQIIGQFSKMKTMFGDIQPDIEKCNEVIII